MKEEMTCLFFDVAKNGVLDKWKKSKLSALETTDRFRTLHNFGMCCSKCKSDDAKTAKWNAKNQWKDATAFASDAFEHPDNYDPCCEGAVEESLMPLSQEPFHFAFCKSFGTSIVIHTQIADANWNTHICSDDLSGLGFFQKGQASTFWQMSKPDAASHTQG